MKPIKIKRVLISVSNKTGLLSFAQELQQKYKAEIISTGGTLEALKKEGLKVIPIDKVTGFPEILDGRVKTLHPKVHGGLLYRRNKASHVQQAKKHKIQAIDMVVVNLYPFEAVTQNPNVDLETAIENIDIGGPSMLRSAAKNHESVAVICDPLDYTRVLEDMRQHKGAVSQTLKQELALKVFERTGSYDQAIYQFLSKTIKTEAEAGQELPEKLGFHYVKSRGLRYGENPHQRAALYVPSSGAPELRFDQLHGKELSFNNFLDIEGAIDIVQEFEKPAACVVKHNNPCGIAEDKDLVKAVKMAIDGDPLSAFGGIVGLNRPCDLKTAKAVLDALHFFEVMVAPSFSEEAVKALQERKNLRLIAIGDFKTAPGLDLRFLKSGILAQDRDPSIRSRMKQLQQNIKTVTKAQPTAEDLEHLLFAFKCVKLVKSNAIVLTQGSQTVGIGAGQMSRVDSVDIACKKAGKKTQGAYLGSDAFFPMPDSIDSAHQHGIRAIIQPGGSVKDQDVINACDQYGIIMVFTGERHFRH